MSTRKWERIVGGESEVFDDDCGFCLYVTDRESTYDTCKMFCPLYPTICFNSGFTDLGRKTLYWKYRAINQTKLAKQILTAIKERGALWIKGEPLKNIRKLGIPNTKGQE
jgi:hypothetical protein